MPNLRNGNKGVMEKDARGSPNFEALETEFYFTACDWDSVLV